MVYYFNFNKKPPFFTLVVFLSFKILKTIKIK